MTLWALLASVGLAFQVAPQPDRAEAEAAAREAPPAPTLTRAPELVHFVDAEYPEAAAEDGAAGEVRLLLTLDETGAVAAVEVAEGVDPRLDGAAVAAARQLRFTPAEVDGEPAPVQLEFRYVFEAPTSEEATGPPPPEPATLHGRVRVRGVRDPISGAVVSAGEAGATTDADGRFELSVAPGTVSVTVRAPGHHPYTTEERLAPGETLEVEYFLLARGRSPYETVVRGDRARQEVGRVTLSREEVEQVPGTFGDPMRVLENLPGMARSPFLGGQLLVRGASPGDSGVHFDGVEIPLLYHFGGLTSVVNPDFLEEIDFRPGGFGVPFGRDIAGVVDVHSRRLTGRRARGAVKIDLMDASLSLRQPLGDDLAVAVAARRSHIDLVLPAFLEAADASDRLTLAPVYFDYQAKVDWDPGRDQEFTVFAFGSSDTFELVSAAEDRSRGIAFDLTLAFHRLVASHRWRLADGLTLTSRPYLGVTGQAFGGGEVGEGGFSGSVRMTNWEAGLREELAWQARENLTLRAGGDLYGLRSDAFLDAPLGFDLLAFPSPTQVIPTTQEIDVQSGGSDLGLWQEAVWEPVEGLTLVPGLRQDLWTFPGASHLTVDPRLAVRWRVAPHTVLKGAAGVYHQPPSIFQVNDVTGNPTLPPEGARHYVVGAEHRVSEVVDVDASLFYVDRYDLAEFSDATRVEDGEVVAERYAPTGRGRAYGAELLLRHGFTDRFFGWVAYTLMRSEERDAPGEPWTLTDFDQTHILTMVGSLKLAGGLEVGARFRLVTGNPYTPVLGAVHDLDTDGWRAVRAPENSARLPTFHQLDVRADYTWTFDLWRLTAYVDLINAYNRENVENFQYDYRYRQRVGFSLLPVFPVLGVKGEW